MSKNTAIVLAGGRGHRMNSDVPKQYLEINGKTLLQYTLEAFAASEVDDLVIVCGAGDEERVKGIAARVEGAKAVRVVQGGKERFDSVYEGLKACEPEDYVLIHDGARCCVTPDLINRMMARRESHPNQIAGVPSKDTIKQVTPDGRVERTLPRETLVSVQTPQSFPCAKIREAHDRLRLALQQGSPLAEGITDDGMVMERFGDEPVYVTEGEDTNIKVTTPSDLQLAEELLTDKKW